MTAPAPSGTPSPAPARPVPCAAAEHDAAPHAAAPSGAPARRVRADLGDWRLKFAALGLIWGFSFVFIKVGTEAFPPLQVALGRMAFGAAVLVAAVAVKRDRLPRQPRVWAHMAVASILCNSLPFSLFAYAELHISSTLAGICNATTPLFSLLVTLVALREERPTRERTAGMLLGFGGVLVVLGAWQGFSGVHLGGTAMALTAALSYALGWAYVRRFLSGTGSSSLSLASTQLLIGTLQLALVVPLFTGVPEAFPADSVLSVLALGVIGTGLAFLLQHSVVRDAGVAVGTMVTYLIPIVATAAGVALLDESLAWHVPVGAVVILAGAALAQHKRT